MKNFAHESTLTSVIQTVWSMTSIGESKEFIIDYLNSTQIKKLDKNVMIETINNCKTKTKLDFYLTNCMFKFEGLGIR